MSRLVGAVLADMHDEWQSGERRYLSEASMALLKPTGGTGTIAAINSGESPHVASLTVSIASLAVLVPVVISRIDAFAFYAALLGVVSLGMLIMFFLANAAVLEFRFTSGKHEGILHRYVWPVVAAIGSGASIVLAVVNFPLLTGGSSFLSNMLMLLVVATFALGVVMALAYRVGPARTRTGGSGDRWADIRGPSALAPRRRCTRGPVFAIGPGPSSAVTMVLPPTAR